MADKRFHPGCYILRDLVDELTMEVMAEVVSEGVGQEDHIWPENDHEWASLDLNTMEFIEMSDNICHRESTADDIHGFSARPASPSVPSGIPLGNREKRAIEEVEDSDVDCSTYLKYIKEGKNANTNRKTDQVIRRVKGWLQAVHGENRALQDIPAQKLNCYMCTFLMTIKKEQKPGTDISTLSPAEMHYQPDTLTSYYTGVARYLREHKYEVQMMSHPAFEVSRGVLATRRAELFKMGLGNKPNRAIHIADGQIDKCWATGAFGATDARSLQSTVYYYFTQAFGWRPRDEPYNCYWEDVSLVLDEETGTRYIEWNERASKTRKGQTSVDPRTFNLKLWQNGTDRCIIPLYELFRAKRPDDYCVPGVKFFLTPKPKSNLAQDDVCYSREEMGKGSLGAVMKKVATRANLHGNIKGHSVRRTACGNLLQQDVAPNVIAQHSGHASLQSLQTYTTPSIPQQRHLCDILVGGKRLPSRMKASSVPTAAASVPLPDSDTEPECDVQCASSPAATLPPASSSVATSASSSAATVQPAAAPGTPTRALSGHGTPSSTSALFYGATFNGPVNIHMHYGNVATQSQVNLSPQMSVRHVPTQLIPLDSGLE